MDTKALRQKILDLAIHGKLVPQDPNDEPASVLLERIRAEKERLIKEGKIKKGKKSAKTSDKPHYPYELPKGWVWCKLEDIAYDLMYGTSEKSSRLGKIPVLRMGNINREGGLDWKDLVYSNNEEDIEKFNLLHNDLLFNRTNSSEWVGKTAIYKGERPAIYAGYIIRLRTIFVNADYINFVMNSQYHRNWCNDVKTDAVNQSNINAQKLSVFRVPLPPIEEQNRIVKEIKRWLSLIKVIKSGKENLQESIKQTKSKVLDLAIHGKLVPQDPNEEPAIELLKRINPKAEIITDNGHYQKLPEGWTICKLKDICSKLVDGDHNPPKGTKETTEYLMLSAQNIVNDNIVYTNGVRYLNHDTFETSDKRTKVMQGDLLITIVGTLGRSCVFSDNKKITLQRSVACLTPLIYNHFLKYYMDSSSIQKYMTTNAKGTAQKGFYLNQLEQLPIMIPPLTEQQRIVARIEKIFARLDVIESAL